MIGAYILPELKYMPDYTMYVNQILRRRHHIKQRRRKHGKSRR